MAAVAVVTVDGGGLTATRVEDMIHYECPVISKRHGHARSAQRYVQPRLPLLSAIEDITRCRVVIA
jgi:hypothetical protein